MQEHVQASVEDGALALCKVNEKQVQANVEVDLENIIEMIVEQENVPLTSMSEEDEHVIGHVEIDVGDIFILTYNLFLHPSSLFERM
jgi:hypothetical protein